MKLAKFKDSERTNTKVNGRYVYRLTYVYEQNGKEYENFTNTVNPDKFGDEEKIVVSITDPEKSVLFNKLPKSIQKK